jgi:hypothetical protein
MDTKEHYTRVVTELCGVIGFKGIDTLLAGGKVRINDNFLTSFVHNESFAPGNLLVYIDMGPPPEGDRAVNLTLLMKINFQLGAGTRGSISLHPESEHLFYSFAYPLKESASGTDLLNTLLRFVAWFGKEAAHAPTEPKTDPEVAKAKDAAVAGRARASRILQQTGGGGPK